MVIRAELYKSKPTKEGYYPIKILFQGKKQNRISTGILCRRESHFDTKKGRFISKNGDAEYKEKNQKLESMLSKFLARKQELEDNGIEPTFELLTADTPIKKHNDKYSLKKIIDERCGGDTKETIKVPLNTFKQYRHLKNLIEEWYGDLDVREVDQRTLDSFREKLQEKYGNEHVRIKNQMLTSFGAIMKYAQVRGYIPYLKFGEIKIWQYTIDKEKLNLTPSEFSIMMQGYKKDIVGEGTPIKQSHKDAICLFMFMVAFQGLSPVDLFKLKKKDLVIETISKVDIDYERYDNDEEYRKDIEKVQEKRDIVRIKTDRKKRGTPVKIVADYESIQNLIEDYYDCKDDEDYIIGTLERGKTYSQNTIQEMSNSYFTAKTVQLNDYLQDYVRRRPDANLKMRNVTYYMARHVFANRLNDLGFDPNITRRYMGHSQGVNQSMALEKHYLAPVNEWKQADATWIIFNQGTTIKQLIEWRNEFREYQKKLESDEDVNKGNEYIKY